MNTLTYPRLSCSWFQWKFYTVISFPVKTSSVWTEMIEIDISVMSFPEFTELSRGRIFVEILPWLSSIKPLFWLHIRLCCNHCFDQRPHADSCPAHRVFLQCVHCKKTDCAALKPLWNLTLMLQIQTRQHFDMHSGSHVRCRRHVYCLVSRENNTFSFAA